MGGRDKHLGAKNELIACTWLLGQGYEVFRNVSQHGECDVIAVKGSEILKIDVKAGSPLLSRAQISNNVKLLTVDKAGNCHLDLDPKPFRIFPEISCRYCKRPFKPATRWQFLCGDFCRNTAQTNRNAIRKRKLQCSAT